MLVGQLCIFGTEMATPQPAVVIEASQVISLTVSNKNRYMQLIFQPTQEIESVSSYSV